MGHAKMFNFVGQQHNQLILTDKEILTLLKEGRDFFTCSAIDGLMSGTWQCLPVTKLTRHDMILISLGQFCKHAKQNNNAYIFPVYQHQKALVDIYPDSPNLFIDIVLQSALPKGIYTFDDVYIIVLDKINLIFLKNFL